MREAMEFAAHLRRCEKDIRKMQTATEGKKETKLFLVLIAFSYLVDVLALLL